MASRTSVYQALDTERSYQAQKFGDLDDRNSIGDFLIYMERELRKATTSYYSPDEPGATLHGIRKVTAVGVAAMEKFGAPQRDN